MQVLAGQQAAHLARLAPMVLSATEAMPATAEPGGQELLELLERLYLLMAELEVSAELEGAEALVELQVVWEAWPGQMV